MIHNGCPPQCLSGVREFQCWRCGALHGRAVHWRQGLPEFRDCPACVAADKAQWLRAYCGADGLPGIQTP
jgi:hypothetical protein